MGTDNEVGCSTAPSLVSAHPMGRGKAGVES